jgi:hypothetical protein
VEAIWDGTTRVETLSDWAATARQLLADHAKRYEWDGVFEVLAEYPEFVNSTRPGGDSWYAPLHQAAHGGAPLPVIDRLVTVGAWLRLRTARGERPVDIAARLGRTHLLDRLRPAHRLDVSTDLLRAIQDHFYEVIRGRAHELVEEHRLRLPELEVLLEMGEPKAWFAIPGMYGGFSFWLENGRDHVQLVTESWCRVVGGSGQRHIVTADGARLVDEGFDL